MTRKHLIAGIIGCAALASGVIGASIESAHAKAKPREIGVEARIPFADNDGVRDFRADGYDALWIQDRSRNWYHAEVIGPCTGLPFANAIGVVTRGTGTLDKFGQLLVEGNICQLGSFVTSDPPPQKAKGKGKRK